MEGEFRLLTAQEMAWVHENHMKRDFPPAELKPISLLQKMLADGRYAPYALFQNGELAAYAFYWTAGEPYALLDYFAVVPSRRNSGTGSQLLREMLDRFCVDGHGVFGEVEIPDTGIAEVDELRQRRLNFYFRAGLQKRGFTAKIFSVPYLVLSYGPEISDAELIEVDRRIYGASLPKAMYEENIFIPWPEEGRE